MSLESQKSPTIENTGELDPDLDPDYLDMSDLVCDEDNCLSEENILEAKRLESDQRCYALHLFYVKIYCHEPDIADFIRSMVVYEFNFEDNIKLLRKAVAWYCSGRQSAVDRFGHIAYWNVSKITNFSNLFAKQKHFNDNINTWDMSSATTTKNMFAGATSFNRPLDKWKMGNVTEMTGMFMGATSFNQPINTWDTSKCTKVMNMFACAKSFDQPLDMWDMSNVIITEKMFYGAEKFNQDISGWKMMNVSRMSFMFANAHRFNQDISKWDLFNIRSMMGVFLNAKSFTYHKEFIRKMMKISEIINSRYVSMSGYIGHNFRIKDSPYSHMKDEINAEIRRTVPLVIY